MTLDLNAIKARVEAATPGPWEVFGRDRHIIGNDYAEAQRSGTAHSQWTHNTTPANAAFIAHARQDIPALLQEIERLTAERDEARKNLGPAAFGFKDGIYNICLGYHPETEDGPGQYEWLEVVAASRLASLSAEYAALGKVVKEWQEAREVWVTTAAQSPVGATAIEDVKRLNKASDALASFPVEEAK